MSKKVILIVTILMCFSSFGQTYYGELITIQNDTIKNIQIKIKGSTVFDHNRILTLQEKVKVIQNKTETEYFPKDLKSFRLNLDGKMYVFDSVDGSFFAQRLYVGRIKLYKFIRKTYLYPNTNIFRYYLVRRPNGGVNSEWVAMGLSRLITKKEMLPSLTDCKISYDKIENDEIKINDEDVLVEFIKDYEKNCY